MRIAIDARMMGVTSTRGIGRFIQELVRAMLQIGGHTIILLEKDPKQSAFASHPFVEHIKADVHWYGIAEQIKMPGLIKSAKADVLFVPHWNVSWFCPIPRVVFVHDLILLEEPLSAHITTRGPIIAWIKRVGFRLLLQRALLSSKRILVPLEYTKTWILKHYPNLTMPIEVVGEGMPDPDPSIWTEADSERPYMLTVGSAYPHKNHETLFQAWKQVAEKHPDLRLLIVGKKDAFMKRLMDRVAGYELRATGGADVSFRSPQPAARSPQIEFLGELSDADLNNLYSKALALVFPSRWEGFGLPPLEAIASGCPVLSSNSSCMPDVLGAKVFEGKNRGVTYFKPDSVNGIVEAIETVLRNLPGVRGDVRMLAPKLRARHDWNNAASRTIHAIEEAVR